MRSAMPHSIRMGRKPLKFLDQWQGVSNLSGGSCVLVGRQKAVNRLMQLDRHCQASGDEIQKAPAYAVCHKRRLGSSHRLCSYQRATGLLSKLVYALAESRRRCKMTTRKAILEEPVGVGHGWFLTVRHRGLWLRLCFL